jgi:hypothetical protein
VKAEWIAAIAGSVSAITAIGLLIVAAWQLPLISKQIRIQGERERKWATVRACDRYSSDPLLHEVAKRVWDVSAKGTDYTDTDRIDVHDVIIMMNYFEVLAIGVRQDLYIEAIVRDFHESIVDKMVKVFLRGESGPNWKVNEPRFRSDQFSVLRGLHEEWSNQASRTEYRDQS